MARKHNLVLQDSWIDWDVTHLTVTDNTTDLVVADAENVLLSKQNPGGQSALTLNGTDLLVGKGTHAHIGDHIARFWYHHDITVASCSHVLSDSTDALVMVSPVYYIWTGDWPDLDWVLPTIECEGQSGQRGELDSQYAYLPNPDIEGYFGARTGISGDTVHESALKLPEFTIEATGLAGGALILERYLPTIIEAVDWDMRFGQTLDQMLPEIRIDAEFAGEFFITVDVTLPGVLCEATVTVPVTAWLDAKLPAITIDTNHTISRFYQLDAALPAFKIEAFSYGGPGATLDEWLPTVRMIAGDSEVIADDLLTLDATLPTVVMGAVGTGVGVDGLPGGIIEETRFDDYVLRYSRTA
jgi:hypothetical protein